MEVAFLSNWTNLGLEFLSRGLIQYSCTIWLHCGKVWHWIHGAADKKTRQNHPRQQKESNSVSPRPFYSWSEGAIPHPAYDEAVQQTSLWTFLIKAIFADSVGRVSASSRSFKCYNILKLRDSIWYQNSTGWKEKINMKGIYTKENFWFNFCPHGWTHFGLRILHLW